MTPVVPDFDDYPIQHLPTALQMTAEALVVTWDDGAESTYPLLWLREYSLDPVTFNHQTREQNLAIIDLPDTVSLSSASIAADGMIQVTFKTEGLTSTYHPGWLRTHCPQNPTPQYTLPDRVLWTAKDRSVPPRFDGRNIADNTIFEGWLGAMRAYGVGLIEQLPVAPGTLETVIDRIGPIRATNFGRLYDVENKADTNSNAYTAQPLRAHTDLATREYQPGIQFFFCMANEVSQGASILSDGFAIAERIRQDHPEQYAFLTDHPVMFVNKDKDSEYRYEVPIFETDYRGNLTTVRFTYWLRAPMTGDITTIKRFHEATSLLHHYADHPDFQIRFRLAPGDLVGFDNRRIFHGRDGFDPSEGARWFRGCYLEREEIESRLRVLDRNKRLAGI
jgi:gamma-butyrobetaine dioxygenase